MDIPTLANSVWQVILPLLPLIATKGAEKLGEEAGTSLWGEGASLWEAVKEKFDGKAETKKVAEKLLAEPESTKMQTVFQYQLEELLEEDANFVKELEKLLETAEMSNTAHVIGGGTVVQGNNSVGVGQGGVYIGGNSEGNTIVTGDGNLVEK